MAKIIDGRVIADRIKKELEKKATTFIKKHGRKCGLAVVLVGNDPASEIYVSNKIKACELVGVASFVHRYAADIEQDELIKLICNLNDNKSIDGILVQLPLPNHIDSTVVVEAINPQKDVDGFCAVNAGKLSRGEKGIIPCTALGCLELIKSTGITLPGAHAVVVGRSNIVGKPVAQLLLNHDCTVTVAHSKTKDLANLTKQADILIAAVGKKHFITADMVKSRAVVIDVGINRQNSNIFGDVDFEAVKDIAGYITPVPGRVGPLTVAMLLANVLDSGH